MISLLLRFAVLVVLGVGVALWLVDELRLKRPPKLRTVHLEEVVDSALDKARDVVEALPRRAPAPARETGPAAPPLPDVADAPPFAGEVVEEMIEEPAPFLETLSEEERADDPAPAEAPVVVAARDQDQWARLIRRMLDLYGRTEAR